MRATKFLRGMTLLAILVEIMGSAIAIAQTEKVLHSFEGGNDGTNPSTGLVADSAGNLFGTTTEGGRRGYGVVYELSPSQGGVWTETVIYSFQGADGAAPAAGLIFGQAGTLYGTTSTGGKYDVGTVFQLAPSGGVWTETIQSPPRESSPALCSQWENSRPQS